MGLLLHQVELALSDMVQVVFHLDHMDMTWVSTDSTRVSVCHMAVEDLVVVVAAVDLDMVSIHRSVVHLYMLSMIKILVLLHNEPC